MGWRWGLIGHLKVFVNLSKQQKLGPAVIVDYNSDSTPERMDCACRVLASFGCISDTLLLFSRQALFDSFEIAWAVVHQSSLSIGFPRQEYWSGLPFAITGDLLDLGIEPTSLALAGGFFTTERPGKLKKGIRNGEETFSECVIQTKH